MKKIYKFSFVLLVIFVFGNLVSADSVNITQINFTSSPQTIDINTVSAQLTTQTQNTGGTLEQTNETNHLDLASTSPTGEFSSNGTNWSSVNTLTMSTGSANKNFFYRDSTAGTYTLTISAQGQTWTPATQSITVVDPAPAPTSTFFIRNGDSVLYNGSVSLPSAGTVSINDSNNTAHTINARSVLAVLKNIDDNSGDFSISNLQYFSSFGSFYLKCILPNGGTDLCDNWQYAIGTLTPFSGIDATILSGGETVGIYFGNSHQLVLNINAITTGSSLNATAQKYNYQDNSWSPLTGVSIGVTLPNPADPFNPTVVSTHPVDAQGNASITITGVNTYTLGIAEDFYFPAYTVNVSAVPISGSAGLVSPTFNLEKAINYLKGAQNTDGSFGESLYTDWAAIAFGAMNIADNSRDLLITYFKSHNSLGLLLTDNERRAMALLALGQNPYSFDGTNYIDAIVGSFDGTQFGDINLVNDDIFALIPLKNSGYTENDDIITKDISFLISKQKTNGSWEESADITAAAIQALQSFSAINETSNALTKATSYLQNGQKNDGGWDSVYSTSWAMQAMNALGVSWTKGENTIDSYLGNLQTEDGAVSPASETLQNRIWATSYAIAGASLKPWSAIMQSVSKSVNTVVNQELPPTLPETNPVVQDITPEDNKIASVDLENKSKSVIALELPKETPDITLNELTASAVNSLPEKKFPQATPVVLGFLSGITLLYFIGKFFAIL